MYELKMSNEIVEKSLNFIPLKKFSSYMYDDKQAFKLSLTLLKKIRGEPKVEVSMSVIGSTILNHIRIFPSNINREMVFRVVNLFRTNVAMRKFFRDLSTLT